MLKETEEYFKLYNKLLKLSEQILRSKGSSEDQMLFALCSAEIYGSITRAALLIDKVANNEHDFSEHDLDELLGDLVNIKILLYHRAVHWMRQLRQPLQKAIDEVEEMLSNSEEKE